MVFAGPRLRWFLWQIMLWPSIGE